MNPRLLGVITFPGKPEQVAYARRYVRDLLLHERVALYDAELLTSECVTNAILQSASAIEGQVSVAVIRDGNSIRVEVIDDGPSGNPYPEPGNGYGLQLVAAIAADWGIYQDAAGSTTWFALETR